MANDLTIPKISRMQFGIIDENFVNRATGLANDFATLQPQLNNIAFGAEGARVARSFLARITDNEERAGTVEIEFATGDSEDVDVAWKYKFEHVTVKDVATIVPEEESEGHVASETLNTDTLEDATGETIWAYNIAEMANAELAPIVFGVDMSTSAYPAGFRPKPVEIKSYVTIWQMITDEDNQVFYVFDRQGVHDGICSAGIVEPEPE